MNADDKTQNWLGSLVVTADSAKQLGWVKDVQFDFNHPARVIVVPTRQIWLPMRLTGACAFSSDDILVSGRDCLIISSQADITVKPQSPESKQRLSQLQHAYHIALLIGLALVVLLLLPGWIILLVGLVSRRVYHRARKKFAALKGHGTSDRRWDDDEDLGYSRVRQPRPPGPLPTDHIALELPLPDDNYPGTSSPITPLQ